MKKLLLYILIISMITVFSLVSCKAEANEEVTEEEAVEEPIEKPILEEEVEGEVAVGGFEWFQTGA